MRKPRFLISGTKMSSIDGLANLIHLVSAAPILATLLLAGCLQTIKFRPKTVLLGHDIRYCDRLSSAENYCHGKRKMCLDGGCSFSL